jgi:hypothetical protein
MQDCYACLLCRLCLCQSSRLVDDVRGGFATEGVLCVQLVCQGGGAGVWGFMVGFGGFTWYRRSTFASCTCAAERWGCGGMFLHCTCAPCTECILIV